MKEKNERKNIAPIESISKMMGIDPSNIEIYGKYKAKLPLKLINENRIKLSNLILVSAITPTPSGEGKTTVSIGLSQAFNKINKKSIVVLSEPSLGLLFGMKKGASGGGYAQVVPKLDINMNFTGDMPAIESANNLLAALIDNNIESRNNNLGIDPRTVRVKRVADVYDRSLRSVITGLEGGGNGVPRVAGFNITAASEVMAILCMSKSIMDLRERLGNIFVGYTYDKKPIYVRDLKINGAMSVLLRKAILPNLVQTIEQTPAIIHGGAFANIAQGTSSIIATQMAMSFCDYAVTETGLGFDLGGEKFLDIKCPILGKYPKVVVLAVTLKSLKYHGGVTIKNYNSINQNALEGGIVNLQKHIDNVKSYGITPIVALNKFDDDTQDELCWVKEYCEKQSVDISICDVWERGGEGGEDLANKIVKIVESTPELESVNMPYNINDTICEKIDSLCKNIYGAGAVEYSNVAKDKIALVEVGYANLPICIVKTHRSLSQNPKLLGNPEGHCINISDIELASGAGFIIATVGDMTRMPGLAESPSYSGIDIDENYNIIGL